MQAILGRSLPRRKPKSKSRWRDYLNAQMQRIPLCLLPPILRYKNSSLHCRFDLNIFRALTSGFLLQDWNSYAFPLSLPSQPHDIANWFSSYVYESPDSLGLPEGVGSPVLLPEDGSESQDPMEDSSGSKTQIVPHTYEEKVLAEFQAQTRNSNDIAGRPNQPCKKANSSAAEQNSAPLLEIGVSPLRRNCGLYDSRLLGLEPKPCANEDSALSLETLPVRKNYRDQVSGQVHVRELNSHLQQQDSDLRVNCDIRSYHVEKDGYISVRNKDSLLGNDQRWPGNFFSDMNSDRTAPTGGDSNKRTGDSSNKSNNTGNKQNGLFGGTDYAPPKKKLNLKKLLGEEHIASVCSQSSSVSVVHTECIRMSVPVCNTNKEEDDSSPQVENSSIESNTQAINETGGFISTKSKGKCGEDIIARLNSSAFMNFEKMTTKTATSEELRKPIKSQDNIGSLEEKQEIIEDHRIPLSNVTNYQAVVASHEIPGKWQCPRKIKTDLGPPKKQLRLDRWFHLLNSRSTIL